MAAFATFFVIALAVPTIVASVVLWVECVAALFAVRDHRNPIAGTRPSAAIIVPAHNEAAVIGESLRSIRPQLAAGDRLMVVADNCTDATAIIAREEQAHVLERHDTERRGKGFALDEGVRWLRERPPEVVVVVDADCLLGPGCLDILIRQSAATQRPAQGAYCMLPPPEPRPTDLVSALAVFVKNFVRPLGLSRLGLPCLLSGSGMAFPWRVLERFSLADGNIVEDMQLSVDLCLAGFPPLFCPAGEIRSLLPSQRQAVHRQRKRWEHGHMATILSQTPRLFWRGLRSGNLAALGMMFDIFIPPLSMLVTVWGVTLTLSVLVGLLFESWVPALLMAATGAIVLCAITVGWIGFARKWLPLSTLFAVPWYVGAKIPLYLGFWTNRERTWISTNRDAAVPGPHLAKRRVEILDN